MKHNVANVNPQVIMELYEESRPNFGVALDYPLMPDMPLHVKWARKLKTLSNTKVMLESKETDNHQLIPVIHGFQTKSINWFVSKLKEIGMVTVVGGYAIHKGLQRLRG